MPLRSGPVQTGNPAGDLKMIRSLTTALVLAALTIPSAQAANFSGIRCESRDIITILEDNVRNSKAQGTSIASYGIHTGKITKSVTEHASRDKLICGITLQMTVAGESQHLRLRYTIRQFSNGTVTATLSDR
jgi:hypothetical protein